MLKVTVATDFFNRVKYMYSFGKDAPLLFPVPENAAFTFIGGIALWAFPLIVFAGVTPFSLTNLAILILPPLGLAFLAGWPIYEGRTFYSWMSNYLRWQFNTPRVWRDSRAVPNGTTHRYTIPYRVTIGRTAEQARLIRDLVEELNDPASLAHPERRAQLKKIVHDFAKQQAKETPKAAYRRMQHAATQSPSAPVVDRSTT